MPGPITIPNVLPPENNSGKVGKSGRQWAEVRAQSIYQNGVKVAPIASPEFTGTPSAPTANPGTNTTQIATTEFVGAAVTAGVAGASNHAARTDNPHAVTKAQVGLGNATNTSDADKPVSTAQAAAIQVVYDVIDTHAARTDNPHAVTKAQVGLSNVANVDTRNASNINAGLLSLERGGIGIDLSAIPKGSILVANANGVISILTSTTAGHVPSINGDGEIEFSANTGGYTDGAAVAAFVAAILNSDSIRWDSDPETDAPSASVIVAGVPDLVPGDQELLVRSYGLVGRLGTSANTAGRGDYTPTAGQKSALQGHGGTPGNTNRYVCGRFDLLDAATGLAATTKLPVLKLSETTPKGATVEELALVPNFRQHPVGDITTGTDRVLALTDAGQFLRVTTAADYRFTVPANATVAFPVGSEIHFQKSTSHRVILDGADGVTLLCPPDRLTETRTTDSVIALKKVETNTWVAYLDLASSAPPSSSSSSSPPSSSSSPPSSSSSSAPPSSSSSASSSSSSSGVPSYSMTLEYGSDAITACLSYPPSTILYANTPSLESGTRLYYDSGLVVEVTSGYYVTSANQYWDYTNGIGLGAWGSC